MSDIDTVYRDNKIKGDIHSGEHWPDKPDIRALLKQIQNSGGQAVTRNTIAALNAVTPPAETYMGIVLTGAGAGMYSREDGAWVFGRPFSDTFAKVVLTGSGTVQTGVVSTGVNPAGVEVFYARVASANTGPLTLSIGGEPPREVLNLAGNPLTAGEWTGTVMFEMNDAGKYQLVIDAGASAAAAQSAGAAGAQADRAEAAAEAAEGALSSITTTAFATRSVAQAYNPTVAPVFLQLAGYAAPGDGGGALYKKVASEPSHAGKLQITEGSWYEIAECILTERMFGAPCDGSFTNDAAGTDARSALQAWLDCPVSKFRRFTGISRVTDGLTFPAGLTIEGGGHWTGINAAGGLATEYEVMKGEGSLALLPGLSANVAKGVNALPMTDASAVNAGDIIRIRNPAAGSWSAWRPDYSAGEFIQVLRKSGNTVYFTNPLYDSYTAASVELHKLEPISCAQVILRDFRIKQPPTDYKHAILVRNNIGTRIENVYCSGSEHAAIILDTCVKLYVNTSLDGAYDATPDNEYGLSINSCQWGTIHGVYTAQRHAIAQGTFAGNVPNRALLIMVANMGNNFATAANDVGHAGNEDITFVGGTFAGGSTGGKNIRYVGVRFRRANDGAAIYGGEHIEGDFIFDGCTFDAFVNPNNPASIGVIELGNLTANTTGKCRFFFNDCLYKAPPATVYFIRLHINGVSDANAPEIYVNGGHVDAPGVTQFVRLVRSSGGGTIGRVRVKGTDGLPSAASPVVNAGPGITVTEYELDDQEGAIEIVPSTAVSAATANVTFARAYPVAPKLVIPVGNGSVIGGDRYNLISGTYSGTGCTISALTADGGNFASTTSGTVQWLARW